MSESLKSATAKATATATATSLTLLAHEYCAIEAASSQLIYQGADLAEARRLGGQHQSETKRAVHIFRDDRLWLLLTGDGSK